MESLAFLTLAALQIIIIDLMCPSHPMVFVFLCTCQTRLMLIRFINGS